MALDLNRGCLIRFHPANRMQIAMYIDSPGEYYTETGSPVAPELARQAGFDVEKDMRQKVANARLAAAKRQIEAEMRAEEDAIAQVLSDRSKLDVRHIGGGQYALFDKVNGKQLTKVAMTKADIEVLIGAVPADPSDPKAVQALLGTGAAGGTQPALNASS